MATRQATALDSARGPWGRVRLNLPSWLVSLVLHTSLMIGLLLIAHNSPRGLPGLGASFEGVSMGDAGGDGEGGHDGFFDDEPPLGSGETLDFQHGPAGDGAGESGGAAALFDDRPPVDTAGSLPALAATSGTGEGTGPTAGDLGGATSAGGFADGKRGGKGGAGTGRAGPVGGRARTKVYGIEADGFKFVYVFDRSGSMGGSGNNGPLNSAKRQLLASLENLQEVHQFQIIFYNERPVMFGIAGHPDKLVFGTPANRRSAEHFVNAITADGATEHEGALWAALRLQPDVIFFLTDADQPAMSPEALAKIKRANSGGCSINTIEFGPGPQVRKDNFLVQLARENNGHYKYIDVARPIDEE